MSANTAHQICTTSGLATDKVLIGRQHTAKTASEIGNGAALASIFCVSSVIVQPPGGTTHNVTRFGGSRSGSGGGA
eukprot:5959936-Heterocapsa_arctica.AAC.1